MSVTLCKRCAAGVLALALALVLAVGGPAWAYSYGAVEKEAIVEAYTAAAAALGKQPPAWAEAEAAFAPVAAEVEKDAGGPQAVAAWRAAVQARDSQLAIRVLRGVVYENLLRRLRYARDNLGDYARAKALMTKATVTYEALSPVVAGADAQLDLTVRRRLDDAQAALGNPGVLGVGIKPADPQAFDAAVAAVRAALAPRLAVDFAAAAAAAGKAGAGQAGGAAGPASGAAGGTQASPGGVASGGDAAGAGEASAPGTASAAGGAGAQAGSGASSGTAAQAGGSAPAGNAGGAQGTAGGTGSEAATAAPATAQGQAGGQQAAGGSSPGAAQPGQGTARAAGAQSGSNPASPGGQEGSGQASGNSPVGWYLAGAAAVAVVALGAWRLTRKG